MIEPQKNCIQGEVGKYPSPWCNRNVHGNDRQWGQSPCLLPENLNSIGQLTTRV